MKFSQIILEISEELEKPPNTYTNAVDFRKRIADEVELYIVRNPSLIKMKNLILYNCLLNGWAGSVNINEDLERLETLQTLLFDSLLCMWHELDTLLDA